MNSNKENEMVALWCVDGHDGGLGSKMKVGEFDSREDVEHIMDELESSWTDELGRERYPLWPECWDAVLVEDGKEYYWDGEWNYWPDYGRHPDHPNESILEGAPEESWGEYVTERKKDSQVVVPNHGDMDLDNNEGVCPVCKKEIFLAQKIRYNEDKWIGSCGDIFTSEEFWPYEAYAGDWSQIQEWRWHGSGVGMRTIDVRTPKGWQMWSASDEKTYTNNVKEFEQHNIPHGIDLVDDAYLWPGRVDLEEGRYQTV